MVGGCICRGWHCVVLDPDIYLTMLNIAFQKKRESNDIKHSFPASPLSKLPSIPDHVQW